jgi:hypothetical protein
MLLAAETVAPPDVSAIEPDPYERWLIRDLVETAWALASRRSADPHADWTVHAREALERLAWRVLEPRRQAENEPDELLRPVRWLKRG